MKQLITKILLLSSLLTLGACSAESNQKTSNTDSTVSSSVKDTSSESKEKEEQKVKEIAEKKKQANIAQKTSSAETILAQAEANPTRDNYDSALSAIQAIPGGNQSLSNRLANVDSAIKANEAAQAEAAKIAEQQRQQAIAQEQARQAAVQAEQQRQAQLAQEQAAAQAQQQNNQETVLITPTGKKYHNHVCGNGNYSPATLQEALNRGLTACEKCFN